MLTSKYLPRFLGERFSSPFWAAFAVTLFLVLVKLQLIGWFWSTGLNPFNSVPKTSLPFILGADLLVSGVVFWCAFLLCLLDDKLGFRRFFASVAMTLLYVPIVVLTVISFKITQTYGVPLDAGHISAIDSVVRASDSLVESVDQHVLLAALWGVLGYIAVLGALLRAPSVKSWGVIWFVVGLMGLALVYVVATPRTLSGVYTYGLKKNAVVNVMLTFKNGKQWREKQELLDWHAKHSLENGTVEWLRLGDNFEHKLGGLGIPAGTLKGQNVLLVLLESTSRFHLTENTMPALDGLRQKSVSLQFHVTTSATSKESVYSLFYSDYLSHELRGAMRSLHGDTVQFHSLAESIKSVGYRTAVFQSGYLGYTDFWHMWEGKGVDRLVGAEHILGGGKNRLSWSWGAFEEDTVSDLIQWVGKQAVADTPFFATYRPVFPHHPYHSNDPVKVASTQSNRGRHANALYYVDRQIKRIIDFLDEIGVYENTLVVVVADHGETLGDSVSGHGLNMSGEELIVPMFFYSSKLQHYSQFYSGLSNHLDVAPTIASLLGVQGSSDWEGRDLTRDLVRPIKALLPQNHARQSGVLSDKHLCVKYDGGYQVSRYDSGLLRNNLPLHQSPKGSDSDNFCAVSSFHIDDYLLYKNIEKLRLKILP